MTPVEAVTLANKANLWAGIAAQHRGQPGEQTARARAALLRRASKAATRPTPRCASRTPQDF
jgi:hypothetical protein